METAHKYLLQVSLFQTQFLHYYSVPLNYIQNSMFERIIRLNRPVLLFQPNKTNTLQRLKVRYIQSLKRNLALLLNQ